MQLLFRLPFALLEMVLRRGLGIVGELAQLLRGGAAGGADDVVVPAPARSAPPTPPTPPTPPAAPVAPRYEAPTPPTADEAIRRRVAREAQAANGAASAVPPAPAPAPLRPIRETPHVDRQAEIVESFGPADDVVATIEVDEPWGGYDAMPATAIVMRLRGADPATKGVVRLYEQQRKKRATILRATG